MKQHFHPGIRWMLLFCLLVIAFSGTAPQTVYAETVDCADPCNSLNLQDAINRAAPGDVIQVPAGTFTLDTEVLINKAVTIRGQGPNNTIFKVSGTGYRFNITGAGVTLEDFEILKTDKMLSGVQNIILLNANNITVQRLLIHGQWMMGENSETSRAFESAGGLTGIVIQNNNINNLRQPGYLNDSEITLRGNVVYTTRGWVLDKTNATLINNIWGDGDYVNAVDICIFPGTNPAYYPDLLALSADNYNAVIEDQRTGQITHVWVDANASSGNGYRVSPTPSIQAGINKVVPGGTVYVGAGTYRENNTTWNDLAINKSLTLLGAGKDQTIVELDGAKTNGVQIDGKDLDVEIRNISFTRRAGSDYGPTYALRFGETASTFQQIYLGMVDISYARGRNVFFDRNGTYANVTLMDSEFHHAGAWGFSIEGPTTGMMIEGSSFNDNGSADPAHGIGLDLGSAGVTNLTVGYCTFARNTMKAINLANTSNALFAGVWVMENGSAPQNSAMTIWEWGGTHSTNITVRNSHFLNNGRMAILLGAEDGSAISGVTIRDNFFTNNGMGALYAASLDTGQISNVVVTHNSIVNAGTGITDTGEHGITAENNWWGCNEGPGKTGCPVVSESVDANPWLVLRGSPEHSRLKPGQQDTFSASMLVNSAGETIVDTQTNLMSMLKLTFTTTGGSLIPTTKSISRGTMKALYTAPGTTGKYQACAVLDNATSCATYDVAHRTFIPAAQR